ncbi:MAG: type II secretion system protein [Planctomycetes bacterium]|nr:type II secretion system protein [Planctomycetota bacterium]
MNYKLRTNKAFTLIELVVAIAILVMMISFASVIFKVSINTYRTATANTEIMQKLRAITDQLNADFKGVRRSFPGKARHILSGLIRSDSIAFLANGDFQSTGQPFGRTVVGNVASIFYGLADPPMAAPKDKILVRRQKILTFDSSLPFLDPNNPLGVDEEYCTWSLSEWGVRPPAPNIWLQKPVIDSNDPRDLVMYMAKGVDDFAIQFARWDPFFGNYTWWPDNQQISGLGPQPLQPVNANAIKFTFTLYDSKGIIKNGRLFTHIIYLRD